MSVRTVPYGREKAEKGDRVLVTCPAYVPSKSKGKDSLVQGTAQWHAVVVQDLGGDPGLVRVRWEEGGEEEVVQKRKCRRASRATDKRALGSGITALHGPGARARKRDTTDTPVCVCVCVCVCV